MKILLRILLLLYCLVPAVATAETGQAVAVITDARATLGPTTRVLVAGSDLAIGETVVTDARGQVQVLFSDNTELVIGPNSSLVLEDYLVRGDGSVGRLAINALSGTFRFATGNSPRDAYSINTPGGTIGIRGTAFDFFILDGVTYLIMYHGTATLCSGGSSCVEVSQSCQVGASDGTSAQVVGLSTDASPSERESLRAGFRYAANQAPLEPGFRIGEVPQCQLAGPRKLQPVDVAGVLDTCAPVVTAEYGGNRDRWGECGAAVAGYIGALDPDAPDTPQVIADLVVRLAELFDPGGDCVANPTELPDAIILAASLVRDAEQRAGIEEIAATIEDCVVQRTAALPVTEASVN